jgi:hypothetical protein
MHGLGVRFVYVIIILDIMKFAEKFIKRMLQSNLPIRIYLGPVI